jgi:phage shock protein PspC (stress-responsive transcriptional regulator)
MNTKLYRSTTDKMLGGVCAGLGTYFSIDRTIVRLFFVVLTLLGGFGPLVYIILWIVIPQEGTVDPTPGKMDSAEFKERAEQVKDEFVNAVQQPAKNTTLFVGAALILAGGYFLVRALNLSWLQWLDKGFVWAALVLLAGVALLVRAFKKE